MPKISRFDGYIPLLFGKNEDFPCLFGGVSILSPIIGIFVVAREKEGVSPEFLILRVLKPIFSDGRAVLQEILALLLT